MASRFRRVDLKKALFVLPNLFTLSSIFCGFYACVLCASNPSRDDLYGAALLIVFAGFFDTIDGRVARLTKTQSAFGVQIDSLADVASFGVAPALLVYRWELFRMGFGGALLAFAFLACGAIRLARFNVLAMAENGAPKKPGKFILGLPIPGAAGILVSYLVANEVVGGFLPAHLATTLIAGVVVALSALMVSTIQFRSFKDTRFSPLTALVVLGVVSAVIATGVVVHPSAALLLLGGGYVLLSVAEATLRLSRRIARIGRVSVPPPPGAP